MKKKDDTAVSSYMGLAEHTLGGVTVAFLSQVFRMDQNKVKRLLVNCEPKETRRRGRTQIQVLYDLAEAAEYLVKPKADSKEIIKALRKEDLPPALNTAFWDAQLKRQKWEENAGQLWRTETIRSVIGGMFQTIKFTIQLWADTIERQTGLTEDQRALLNELTDELQAEMFASLKENAKATMTGPQLVELEHIIAEVRDDPDKLVEDALEEREEQNDDDAIAALI